MQTIDDLAIVLRTVRYEERHKIITAITQEHGLVSVIAKNSVQSRRFGGTLELFTASDWNFSLKPGSELGHLTSTALRRSFEELTKDFQKLSTASVLSELMARVAPKLQSCSELFQLHANSLVALCETKNDSDLIVLLNAYLTKFLLWCGTQPRLGRCLECQTEITHLTLDSRLGCPIEMGGWVCPKCMDSRAFRFQVTVRAVIDFYGCVQAPIRSVLSVVKGAPEEQRELFQWLDALMVYHVPGFDQYPLKGLRFLGLESSAVSQPDLASRK